MTRFPGWVAAFWGLLVAGLAGVAALSGVIARGDGTTQLASSVRGTTYEVAANGVYAFNAQRVVAEGIGWDAFTLVIAVPALLIATWFVARGSFSGRLVAAGLLTYFVYMYLEYAVTWAFGPLFPLYVAILAASLIGLVAVSRSLAVDGIAGRFADHFPRRGWAALSVALALLLTIMWAGRIFQALDGQADALLMGETTLTVQALDLGLVVPATLVIAWYAWRATDLGYALAAAFSIAFATMTAAIAAMLLSAGMVEGSIEWPPLIIFGLASLAAGYLGGRMFAAEREAAADPPHSRHAQPLAA